MDIESLSYLIDRLQDCDRVFIMDRGLFSEFINEKVRRMKIYYIVPLRRNPIFIQDRKKFDLAFVYNERLIQFSKRSSISSYVYMF